MNVNDSLVAPPPLGAIPARTAGRLLRRLIFKRLRGLRYGCLTVIDRDGSTSFGVPERDAPGNQPRSAPQVTVHIYDLRAYQRLALRGSIGVGESYMAGEWSCDNLTDLIRLFIINREVMMDLETGMVRLAMPLFRAGHALRRNSRANSRANIAAHYDLSNEFYQLFLDRTLMYSSAIFPHPDASLEEASLAKLERICQKLALGPDDHVLEIGTGWGGFAVYAAERYGCRVTTTTISERQYALATQRVRDAGVGDRVTVLLNDYRDLRDLEGRFDKLVSIEMIEAVGHQYFETYFRTCSRLLKDDGMMLLQAITIADQHYQQATKIVDFIQKYIFPGGCLPSITAISQTLTKASDLKLFHLEDIGPHYALTLRHWRERFHANLDKVRALGFSDPFIRMWDFYLCYCEGGFVERNIGTVQVLMTKPLCRRQPILPAL